MMTSWASITMVIDKDAKNFTGPPTGLGIDSGNDEYGFIDDERLYALSYGRYQKERYKSHVHDFHSAWFNGVWKAIICDVENTGDNVDAIVYRSQQEGYDSRVDGMSYSKTYNGKRWPDDERNELLDRIEQKEGFRPVVEPRNTHTPPDAVLRKS